MKVLVTGGAGYVGSHTVKELKKRGFNVIVYDNLSRGHRWALKGDAFAEGDLADEGRLNEVFLSNSIAVVLHFAALAYVGESVIDPKSYYENNVGNTLTLLRVMLNHGVRAFVLSSTCAVYGIPKRIPIVEDHPTEPVNPYGKSKVMVERILDDYDRAYGLKHISLRYFNAAGADPEGELGEDHQPEPHLIPRIFQIALGKRQYLEIYGSDYPTKDGTCIRDYVHVTDLADAHIRAVEWLMRRGRSRTINLGTGHGYSVLEVLEMARQVTGHPIPVVVRPRRPGDPPALVSSSERAREELGWTPCHSTLSAVLETAWAWHKQRE